MIWLIYAGLAAGSLLLSGLACLLIPDRLGVSGWFFTREGQRLYRALSWSVLGGPLLASVAGGVMATQLRVSLWRGVAQAGLLAFVFVAILLLYLNWRSGSTLHVPHGAAYLQRKWREYGFPERPRLAVVGREVQFYLTGGATFAANAERAVRALECELPPGYRASVWIGTRRVYPSRE